MSSSKKLATYFDPDYGSSRWAFGAEILIWNCSLALALLFFLSVRGWLNGVLFVLLGLAVYGLLRSRNGDARAALQAPWARLALIAMLSPFLAILLGQAFRGDIVWRAYDGPLRIAGAGIIFVHLLSRPINITRGVEWAAPISVIFLGLAILLNPTALNAWGGRFATYFVDPLTLGQFATLLGFLSLLLIDITGKDAAAKRILKYSAFAVALWISIGSGARSAWLAMPFLFILLIAFPRKSDHPLKVLPALLIFVVAGAAMYHLSPVVHSRIDEALSDVAQYFGGGNRDTSSGLRLSLWRSAWHLFLESPLRGYGDGNFPPITSIPAIAQFHTPLLEFMLTRTGAHNEFLQNMLRSGIFGLISSVLMFGVPLAIFLRAARSTVEAANSAGRIGIFYIVAIFIFGLNTECFNLKFTASFYGLTIAILAAQALRINGNEHARA